MMLLVLAVEACEDPRCNLVPRPEFYASDASRLGDIPRWNTLVTTKQTLIGNLSSSFLRHRSQFVLDIRQKKFFGWD